MQSFPIVPTYDIYDQERWKMIEGSSMPIKYEMRSFLSVLFLALTIPMGLAKEVSFQPKFPEGVNPSEIRASARNLETGKFVSASSLRLQGKLPDSVTIDLPGSGAWSIVVTVEGPDFVGFRKVELNGTELTASPIVVELQPEDFSNAKCGLRGQRPTPAAATIYSRQLVALQRRLDLEEQNIPMGTFLEEVWSESKSYGEFTLPEGLKERFGKAVKAAGDNPDIKLVNNIRENVEDLLGASKSGFGKLQPGQQRILRAILNRATAFLLWEEERANIRRNIDRVIRAREKCLAPSQPNESNQAESTESAEPIGQLDEQSDANDQRIGLVTEELNATSFTAEFGQMQPCIVGRNCIVELSVINDGSATYSGPFFFDVQLPGSRFGYAATEFGAICANTGIGKGLCLRNITISPGAELKIPLTVSVQTTSSAGQICFNITDLSREVAGRMQPTTAALQLGLMEAGFDPGRPDGISGRKTAAALHDWLLESGYDQPSAAVKAWAKGDYEEVARLLVPVEIDLPELSANSDNKPADSATLLIIGRMYPQNSYSLPKVRTVSFGPYCAPFSVKKRPRSQVVKKTPTASSTQAPVANHDSKKKKRAIGLGLRLGVGVLRRNRRNSNNNND